MNNILKTQYNRLKLKGQKYLKVILSMDADILDKIAAEIIDGVEILEISAGNVSTSFFLETAQKVKLLCAQFDKTLIIDSRSDIAYLTDADGVFLYKNDIPITYARKILGDNAIIGTDNLDSCDADYYLWDSNLLQLNNAYSSNSSCNTDKPIFVKTQTNQNFIFYNRKQ